MHRGTLVLLAASGLIFALYSPMRAQTKSIRSDGTVAQTHSTWSDYASASDASQYSSLSQINRSNVGKLQVAWSYPTSDGNKYLFNPIVVDRTMYVLAHNNSIVAVDAATGKELWIHPTDPKTTLITNRGINYWESADRSDRPLLFAVDNFLQDFSLRPA